MDSPSRGRREQPTRIPRKIPAGNRFVPVSDPARATMTISVGNQVQLNGPHSTTVEQPTLSAYRDALGGLLKPRVTARPRST
ncbi:hypothetical protein [Umezawaea tangerina]|uniref:hypothetical protein n=1 Tax=Umezawaea tangerina TaxID=84725 RepID=UPI0014745B8D|nr:hypothetical protein [Umezawaea tangerina]